MRPRPLRLDVVDFADRKETVMCVEQRVSIARLRAFQDWPDRRHGGGCGLARPLGTGRATSVRPTRAKGADASPASAPRFLRALWSVSWLAGLTNGDCGPCCDLGGSGRAALVRPPFDPPSGANESRRSAATSAAAEPL